MLQNLLYDSGLVRITWYTFALHIRLCGLEMHYPEIMHKNY